MAKRLMKAWRIIGEISLAACVRRNRKWRRWLEEKNIIGYYSADVSYRPAS
jgi:predicted ATP-dependent serine protease